MQTRRLFTLLILLGVTVSSCQTPQPKAVPLEPTRSATEIPIPLTPVPPPPTAHVDQPVQHARSPYQSVKAVQPTIVPPTIALPKNIQPGFPLAIPRTRHTATLLKNGKILIAGGSVEGGDFALDEEIIDPSTGKSKWTAPMHTPRQDHTATLLPDGRVLVVGGYNPQQQWLSDAEVYDPRSDTWTVNPPYFPHGTAHTATLMGSGQVLVVGGCIGSGVYTNKVEIFNWVTNLWTPAAFLSSERAGHTAQPWYYSGVIIIGGYTAKNEIPSDGSAMIYYNNTWYATRPMKVPRAFPQSITLTSDKILVVGGILIGSSPPKISNAVEIYDPRANTWREISPLSKPRFSLTLVPFSKNYRNRQVAAISGFEDWDGSRTGDSTVLEIEVFDPATEQWHIDGELPDSSAFSSITPLPDGTIWVAGGQVGDMVLYSAWLIQP